MTSAPRVLFYVQHLLGIGHLSRASRIAEALDADGFAVTMVTGGSPVPGFPASHIDHVALPPLVSGDEGFSDLFDGTGKPASEDYKAARRDLLLSTFERLKPDIVILEAFPFGRRQMRFELMPLMARIEATFPRPLVATSLRDILQERTKPGRDAETVALVKAHVDAVLVHGDPAFARLEESFALAAGISGKVHYTGIVAPQSLPDTTDRFDVVVSAGGGAVGQTVTRAAIGAAGLVDAQLSWLVIAGPNLPAADYQALVADAPAHVTIARFRKDFGGLLAKAKLSVSQAGYNTVGDILLAGCRSILVPFAAGGETEQSARANRLAQMGRAIVIEESGTGPETLADAVRQALALPDPAAIALDRDGAAGTARVLRQLLDAWPMARS
nr:glycosyltransferase [uncultured Gellertiella sp.]